MEQIPQYKIIYTEAAVLDIEEKADYIETQLGEAGLALSSPKLVQDAGACAG